MPTAKTHPVPSGATVTVFCVPTDCAEGMARILSPLGDEPHFYLVLFDGEALPKIRFVFPVPQTSPASVRPQPDIGGDPALDTEDAHASQRARQNVRHPILSAA